MEFVKSGLMVDGFLEREIQGAVIPACREFERSTDIQLCRTYPEALGRFTKGLEMYKVLIENPPIPEMKFRQIQMALHLGVLVGTSNFFQALVYHFKLDDPRRKEETQKLNVIFLEYAVKIKGLLETQSDRTTYYQVCKVMGVTPP